MSEPSIVDSFPDDFFPASIEQFRQSAARSIGIDPEYMTGPMLAAASVAIGTSKTGVLKPGWEEPASLFVSVVGPKSSGKTPAFNSAFRPLHDQQRCREQLVAKRAEEEQKRERSTPERMPEFVIDGDIDEDEDDDRDDELRSVTMTPWASRRAAPSPPTPIEHLVLTDTTLAALWERLRDSQRGVVVIADELSSVFLQSTPAQRQTWCEVYQTGARTVHRQTSRKGPVILKRTFVTLAGGIQPELFPAIRGKYDGGLLERFLICGKPETGLPPWSDEIIDPDLETVWGLAVVALLTIEEATYDGPPEQNGYVPFTKQAYARLRKLYGDLEAYLQFIGVPVKHHGIVRKLVANAGRLALIRRCLRWAVGEFGFFGPVGSVDETDCDAACRAAEFFLSRYLLWMPQVMTATTEPETSAARLDMDLTDRILAFLSWKKMEEAEVRWIRQQTLEGNPSTDEIRAALDEAVNRGRGRWKDDKKKTFIRG
jgi:hypothetical protein